MRLPWSGSDEAKAETILNEGAELRGDVTVKGPVLIHGRLEGDARCEDRIVVGHTGDVHGDLTARVITVAGRVRGKVTATELIELREGAHLSGEIHAPRLAVQDGARYDGTVFMGPPAPASASASPAPSRPHTPGRRAAGPATSALP